jgi:hypothetical protein
MLSLIEERVNDHLKSQQSYIPEVLLMPVSFYRHAPGSTTLLDSMIRWDPNAPWNDPIIDSRLRWNVIVIEQKMSYLCRGPQKVRIGLLSAGKSCCVRKCSEKYRPRFLRMLAQKLKPLYPRNTIAVCCDPGIDMLYRYFKFMQSGEYPVDRKDEVYADSDDDLLRNIREIDLFFEIRDFYAGTEDGLEMLYFLDFLMYNRVPPTIWPRVAPDVLTDLFSGSQICSWGTDDNRERLRMKVLDYAMSIVWSARTRVMFGLLNGQLTPPHVPPFVLSADNKRVWSAIVRVNSWVPLSY